MYILAQNFALPLALHNTASFCLEKAHKLTVINEKARKIVMLRILHLKIKN